MALLTLMDLDAWLGTYCWTEMTTLQWKIALCLTFPDRVLVRATPSEVMAWILDACTGNELHALHLIFLLATFSLQGRVSCICWTGKLTHLTALYILFRFMTLLLEKWMRLICCTAEMDDRITKHITLLLRAHLFNCMSSTRAQNCTIC